MLRKFFRQRWTIAVLAVVIILLAAALLVAQPGEGSLFGAVPGGSPSGRRHMVQA